MTESACTGSCVPLSSVSFFFSPCGFVLSTLKKLFWEATITQSFVCLEIIYYSFLVYGLESVLGFFLCQSYKGWIFSLPVYNLWIFAVCCHKSTTSQCTFIPTFWSWFFAFCSYYLLVLNPCSCSCYDFCLESSVSVCQCPRWGYTGLFLVVSILLPTIFHWALVIWVTDS